VTPEAARIRRSLRWSVADGASFFVMVGAAEGYFQAFAVASLLLGMVCLYFLLNYLPNPAWTSWMRDLVGEGERGAYFGRRNAIANLAALAATVLAGLFLQLYAHRPLYGFLLLFNLAFLGSAGSTLFLTLQHDPKGRRVEQDRVGLPAFLRELPHSNYGRFVAFNFLLYFGTFLSSPFVVPYMLKELEFSYLEFMVATSLTSLFKFVAMPLWGRLGDRYGSRKILALSPGRASRSPRSPSPSTPCRWRWSPSRPLSCCCSAARRPWPGGWPAAPCCRGLRWPARRTWRAS